VQMKLDEKLRQIEMLHTVEMTLVRRWVWNDMGCSKCIGCTGQTALLVENLK